MHVLDSICYITYIQLQGFWGSVLTMEGGKQVRFFLGSSCMPGSDIELT